MTEHHDFLALIARSLGGAAVLRDDETVFTMPEDRVVVMEKIARLVLEGVDPHTAMAAGVFDVPIEEVTAIQREAMKRRLFGFLYGGPPVSRDGAG